MFIAPQAREAQGDAMPLGLSVALAIAAPAAAGAAAPPSATVAPAAPVASPTDPCAAPAPEPETGEILVCGERPQGYRIDPDIIEAKRLKRSRSAGRPIRPGPGAVKDTSRCAVGPEGCQSAGINLVGAAVTAAQMAERLARGQGIGSMFVTDPQLSEYQLYVIAKRAREAREAEEKAKAAAAAAKAALTAEAAEPSRE